MGEQGNSPNFPVIYSVRQTSDDPNLLAVRLNPVPPEGGPFTLRFFTSGIPSQVENLTCDSKEVQEEEGTWLIPEKTQNLHWQVRLKGSESPVSSQQCVRNGASFILCEPSALPRFKNLHGGEFLKVLSDGIQPTYSEQNPSYGHPLPNESQPPLFSLQNFTKLGTLTQSGVNLTYLLDDSTSFSLVPDMKALLPGLVWLKNVSQVNEEQTFTFGWCKGSPENRSVDGAAGSSVLLVNYCSSEIEDIQVALYTALHESFHQFQTYYPSAPSWAQESLASYYGVIALRISMLPGHARVLNIKFQKAGEKFLSGLLLINAQVNSGNRTDYGAFYTKGISFWAKLNSLLESRNDTLDAHLYEILNMKYDNGDPIELAQILGLSAETWQFVRNRYLD
ncbi:MAG: hypothetical protein K2Y18_01515 [Alphaproteobacteria bacterium]|nr:hypothetical protein [Alphaproteobacteria bacterium]